MTEKRWPVVPLIYTVLLMVPVYWLVTMAFKTNGEIAGRLTLFPEAPTLQHLKVIFTVKAWWMGYVNALIYVCMNVVISVGVALPAAYGFSRYVFPGKRPLFFGFLVFRMMAPVIMLVPFVQIFADLNLYDTHIAVALAHCFFNVPIAVWILEGFISSVPPELDESARVDGYSLIGFFRRILLPLIAPGIAVTAFFCFMFSWVEFLLSNALTAVYAKPISGIMTRSGGVLFGDFGMLAAASVVGFVPGVICIVLVRRHLVRGFSLGRVG
jgi:glycerol transport system permease protein